MGIGNVLDLTCEAGEAGSPAAASRCACAVFSSRGRRAGPRRGTAGRRGPVCQEHGLKGTLVTGTPHFTSGLACPVPFPCASAAVVGWRWAQLKSLSSAQNRRISRAGREPQASSSPTPARRRTAPGIPSLLENIVQTLLELWRDLGCDHFPGKPVSVHNHPLVKNLFLIPSLNLP